MLERQLGKSPVHITPIILGTWAIGGWMWGGTDEKQAIEAIQVSIDHAVTTIDTAPVYGFGISEKIVGKAIRGRRNKVVIATKCGMQWDSTSNVWKNSKPDRIMLECEESLKRLNIDVIDLYQIHWPDVETPIEESWQAMVQLKKQGKVRAIGVSNYSLEQLQKAHAIHPVDSLQSPYSLIRRDLETQIIPFCQKNQIAVLAYSPMERGLLTGTVTPSRQFPKGDHRQDKKEFSPENRKKILAALEQINPIATKHGATLAQVIVHCTYQMPGITAALVGARNSKQALENAQTLRLCLSEQEHTAVVKILSEKELQVRPS